MASRVKPLLLALAAMLAVACGGVDERGATVDHFLIKSRVLARTLHEVGVKPAATRRPRPLLVLLHGRGASTDDYLTDELFAALHDLGEAAPAVLFVDGGNHSYYHDRRNGRWGTHVLREAIPQGAARLGADGRRVAIGGFSMGGFGALDLARLAPSRFCAVAGHSAALWKTGGETPEGAFDDAEDFARHDLFGSAGDYGGLPVWLDAGTDDPFLAAAREFTALLRRRGARVTFHMWPGKHGLSYWNAHMRDYLRFYARALARC